MESEQLLRLIQQHLQLSGYREAAELLGPHVTQVEMPIENLNLQDIYTGWMKLCSLAQRAKQPEIGLKTGTTKQDEAAGVEIAGGEKESDGRTLTECEMEVAAPSTARTKPEDDSEGRDAADETQPGKSDGTANGEEEEEEQEEEEGEKEEEEEQEEEETRRETELAPAEGKSCVSSSSDGTSGPTQGDPDPTRRTRTCESDEDEQQGGDEEEEQELQAARTRNSPEVTEETPEPIDAAQGAAARSTEEEEEEQEKEVEEKIKEKEEAEEDEEDAAAERSVQAGSVSVDHASGEAPPPAEADLKNPPEMKIEWTENEETKPEDEPKTETQDQNGADPPAEEEEEAAEDEDDCIIVKIKKGSDKSANQEPAVICGDSITPKKKKKKKKKSKKSSDETIQVDIAETPMTDGEALTSQTKKKKKKSIKNKEDKTEAEEESQVVSPKKKKKKRKREREETEEKKEEAAFPLENTTKKKRNLIDEVEMKGMDEGNLAQTKQKKRKREALQFKDSPTEGEKEEMNATANSSLLSNCKKKRRLLRTKMSKKKRLQLRKKMMRMTRNGQSTNRVVSARKRQKQKQTVKSPKMQINPEEEENLSKENQLLWKKKKSVKNILGAPEYQSTISREPKKKKVKTGEISPPAAVTQLPPAKNKKDMLKMKPEAAPDKKKKSHKKQKIE